VSPNPATLTTPSSPRRRLLRFGLASLLLLMVPLGLCFVWARDYLNRRPIQWVPYSDAELQKNLREGRRVLVNFTANWSPISMMHGPFALDTPTVTRRVRSSGVVAIRADYTNSSPEITAALQSATGTALIPAVVIYPAASPDRPIVLTRQITEDDVLEALDDAARRVP
jgi:thiol:disulfide interchange protein